MTRVAIIGNAGGGKSVMARQLSNAQKLPLHAIDLVQWKPGWVPTPIEDVASWHEKVIAQDKWIIDGWGSEQILQKRFDAADTIVLIDHPLWVHYWWSAKRQFQSLFRPRQDGPEGCPMLPMTWPLIKMIWHIHKHYLPELRSQFLAYQDSKNIFHIRSPRELHQFVTNYC